MKADAFDESDIGSCEWDRGHNPDSLTISDDGRTVGWEKKKREQEGKLKLLVAWVPASTRLHLHSGNYRWDFIVENMAKAQIGVGYMLLWNVGPDWGFFGYLGASPTAFACDPSTGDVVCNTKSIQAGLPKFTDAGVVSVHLELPRQAEGSARFLVDGVFSDSIQLPEGVVVLPAACFLKEGQRVTLASFERRAV